MDKKEYSKELKDLLKKRKFKNRVPTLKSYLEIINKLCSVSADKSVSITKILETRYSEQLKELETEKKRKSFIANHRPQISRLLLELEDWGLISKILAQRGGNVKVVKLTKLGKEVVDHDELLNLKSSKSKKKKPRSSIEDKIPLSARNFHSEKIRELVVGRLLEELPVVEDDGFYIKSGDCGLGVYVGQDLDVEVNEVLFQDFLENHLEFASVKEFKDWFNKFKGIVRKWWKENLKVSNGIKLELERYLELPLAHHGDERSGFTENLINWVLEALKCRTDPSCMKYYYNEYFVNEINYKIEETIRRDILTLDYRNEKAVFIFKEKGDLNPDEFKAKMDKKIKDFMKKKIHKSPFYKHYQDNLKLLKDSKDLRNKIIEVLKKNYQIPLYKTRNCPYLAIVPTS